MFNPLPTELHLPDSRPSFRVFLPQENRNLKFCFASSEYEVTVTDYTSLLAAETSPPPNDIMSLCGDLKEGIYTSALAITTLAAMIFAAPIGYAVGYWDGDRVINLAKGHIFTVIRNLQGCVGSIVAFVARDTGLSIYNNILIQKACYKFCLQQDYRARGSISRDDITDDIAFMW